jgi:hypothetical protein
VSPCLSGALDGFVDFRDGRLQLFDLKGRLLVDRWRLIGKIDLPGV